MFTLRNLFTSTGLVLTMAVSASAQVNVSDYSFNREVLQSDRVVVVDFYADWCGPCRDMAPRIAQLATEHPGVKVVQVDVDRNERLSQRYRIESIPTTMVFFRGEVVAEYSGAMSYSRLDRFLHDAIDTARRMTLESPEPLAAHIGGGADSLFGRPLARREGE